MEYLRSEVLQKVCLGLGSPAEILSVASTKALTWADPEAKVR